MVRLFAKRFEGLGGRIVHGLSVSRPLCVHCRAAAVGKLRKAVLVVDARGGDDIDGKCLRFTILFDYFSVLIIYVDRNGSLIVYGFKQSIDYNLISLIDLTMTILAISFQHVAICSRERYYSTIGFDTKFAEWNRDRQAKVHYKCLASTLLQVVMQCQCLAVIGYICTNILIYTTAIVGSNTVNDGYILIECLRVSNVVIYVSIIRQRYFPSLKRINILQSVFLVNVSYAVFDSYLYRRGVNLPISVIIPVDNIQVIIFQNNLKVNQYKE